MFLVEEVQEKMKSRPKLLEIGMRMCYLMDGTQTLENRGAYYIFVVRFQFVVSYKWRVPCHKEFSD